MTARGDSYIPRGEEGITEEPGESAWSALGKLQVKGPHCLASTRSSSRKRELEDRQLLKNPQKTRGEKLALVLITCQTASGHPTAVKSKANRGGPDTIVGVGKELNARSLLPSLGVQHSHYK